MKKQWAAQQQQSTRTGAKQGMNGRLFQQDGLFLHGLQAYQKNASETSRFLRKNKSAGYPVQSSGMIGGMAKSIPSRAAIRKMAMLDRSNHSRNVHCC